MLLQYAFYLFYCAITTSSQHFTIRWLASLLNVGGNLDEEGVDEDIANANPGSSASPIPAPPKKPTPNAISTALFVSSCMSLFPILMVVWKNEDASESSTTIVESSSNSSDVSFSFAYFFNQGPGVDRVRRGVSWAVAVQNLEALRILLGCGYWGAGGLVAAGGMVRWLVKVAVLEFVGLAEAG